MRCKFLKLNSIFFDYFPTKLFQFNFDINKYFRCKKRNPKKYIKKKIKIRYNCTKVNC